MKKIVSIHGTPRSGTSWLGQILDSSENVRYKFQPLFSYAFKDRISLNSGSKDIGQYYDELYRINDNFLDQEDKKQSGSYPVFPKKESNPEYLVTKMVRYHYLLPHLLESVNSLKGIGIVRHPCGVLNSWRKAPREFNPEWDFQNEWYFGQSKNKFRPEEYYGYMKWKELTNMFLELERQFPEKFYLIRYEDLVQNPLECTRDMYNFLGLKLEDQTTEFINASTSKQVNDVYSVFKGNKDLTDWDTELHKYIQDKIFNDLKGTKFERFLTVYK